MANQLRQSVTDATWHCAPSAEMTCPCVESHHIWGNVRLHDIQMGPQAAHLSKIFLNVDTQWYLFVDVEVKWHADDLLIKFSRAYWSPPDNTGFVAVFDDGRIGEYTDGLSVEFEGITWRAGADLTHRPDGCEADSIWGDDPGLGEQWATASGARHMSNDWSVEGFRLAGKIAPPTSSSPLPGKPARGFLPGVLRAYDGGARLTAPYYLGTIPVAVSAHGDLSAGAGLGASFLSTSPFCSTPLCAGQIDVDGFANIDGPAGVTAGGNAVGGSARRHASVEFDGLYWSGGDESTGEILRLERGTLFQDWSLQRAGVALSGPRHTLAIHGTMATRAGQGFEVGEASPWHSEVTSHYGTRIDMGMAGRADVRLHHREVSSSATPHARSTAAMLRLDRVIGDTRRAYVRPAAQGEIGLAMVQGPTGSVAGSRTTLDALVDAGLAFRGELGSAIHHILPRVILGRRMLADDALPHSAVAVDHARTVVPVDGPFNFAGISLEQRLDLESAGEIRLPLGITFVDDGRGSDWKYSGGGSVEYFQADGSRPFLVAIDGQCATDCSDIGLAGRLQLQWTSNLRSAHIVGRGLDGRFARHGVGGVVRTGFAPLVVPAAADVAVTHASRVRAEYGRWAAGAGWYADLRTPKRAGYEARIGQYWRELGWGVDLRLAALPHHRRWAAMVGLSISPAF